MRDDEFEWDDGKATQNYAVHRITFEAAREVFRDPFAIDWIDEREDYGEDRSLRIGMTRGRLLYVCYTMRGARKRIIPARAAEPFERRRYHEQDF